MQNGADAGVKSLPWTSWGASAFRSTTRLSTPALGNGPAVQRRTGEKHRRYDQQAVRQSVTAMVMRTVSRFRPDCRPGIDLWRERARLIAMTETTRSAAEGRAPATGNRA